MGMGQVEAMSGQFGIFVARTQVLERQEEVWWIERKVGEDRDAYFTRVLTFADSRKQSLKYRKFGGNDLGVVKLAADPTRQPTHTVDVQGIPKNWDGEDVINFLKSEQWSDVAVLNRRRSGKGIFRWTPPATFYIDQKDDEWNVIVSKVAWNARQPESLSVRPPRRQPQDTDAPNEGRKGPGSKTPTVAPTQLDQGDSQEDTKVAEKGEAGRQRSRSPAPNQNRKLEQGQPAQPSPSLELNSSDLEWLDKQGWKRVDNGGIGDCGFRAICAAKEWNQTGQGLTNEAAQRHGAILRAQVLGHIRKHLDRFKPSLLKDKDTSPDSPPPTAKEIHDKVEQYRQEAAKATTWIDGLLLQACSEKLGIPVIIWWKSQHNVWKRHTCAPAFDEKGIAKIAKGAKPVVLALESQHYKWVQQPDGDKIPRHWLSETIAPDIKTLAGKGGGSTASRDVESVAAPSVHSLAKVPSVSGLSVATPSVYSVPDPLVAGGCPTPSVPSGVPVSVRGVESGVLPGYAASAPTPSVHTLCPAGSVPAAASGSCCSAGAPLKRMRVKGPCSLAFSAGVSRSGLVVDGLSASQKNKNEKMMKNFLCFGLM